MLPVGSHAGQPWHRTRTQEGRGFAMGDAFSSHCPPPLAPPPGAVELGAGWRVAVEMWRAHMPVVVDPTEGGAVCRVCRVGGARWYRQSRWRRGVGWTGAAWTCRPLARMAGVSGRIGMSGGGWSERREERTWREVGVWRDAGGGGRGVAGSSGGCAVSSPAVPEVVSGGGGGTGSDSGMPEP
jgi:hypothetical protein